jgi:DNA repair photolyase
MTDQFDLGITVEAEEEAKAIALEEEQRRAAEEAAEESAKLGRRLERDRRYRDKLNAPHAECCLYWYQPGWTNCFTCKKPLVWIYPHVTK